MYSANVVVKNVIKKDPTGGEKDLMEVVVIVMMTAEEVLEGKVYLSVVCI